ncbi:unnamed protein product [Paramecium sonneborni]|uniref:Uncharacterized protein n=1 Tax=Paramecium sonneborni TaxID=65129 RepID=A0A8S1RQ55_9CILI|nr:unnamed protein product [Paramecium sonneborni]
MMQINNLRKFWEKDVKLTYQEVYTRVKPPDIEKDFANILKDELIETQVQLFINLHRALKFKGVDDPNFGNKIKREIGNATITTTQIFEYQVKNDQELQKEQIHIKDLKSVPFQNKVTYTNLHGDKLQYVKEAEVEVIHKRIAQKNSIDRKLLRNLNLQQLIGWLCSKKCCYQQQPIQLREKLNFLNSQSKIVNCSLKIRNKKRQIIPEQPLSFLDKVSNFKKREEKKQIIAISLSVSCKINKAKSEFQKQKNHNNNQEQNKQKNKIFKNQNKRKKFNLFQLR